MAEFVTLEHTTLKDEDGNPRTISRRESEAEVLLRGDRGWRKPSQPSRTRQTPTQSSTPPPETTEL